MGVILHTYPVCGESHVQHHDNREVETAVPPFYNKPHRLHVLSMKSAPGMIFTSWSQHHFVAIRKPERHVHKSFTQLQQVTIEITCHDHSYCLFTPHIYIYGCFSLHTSHLWWIAHSTQCQPRGCNSAYTTYFTNHTWLLCCSSKSDMRMQCLTNCISKIYYHRCFLLPVWKHDIFNFAQNSSVTPGLQKVWKSGRSFPGNRTCSREINQLQVM